MGNEGIDELEMRRHGGTVHPPALADDATRDDMIEAINALAKASRTHSVELEGIRLATQELGTRIETFCQRIERALGGARTRSTDPAPGGDAA